MKGLKSLKWRWFRVQKFPRRLEIQDRRG